MATTYMGITLPTVGSTAGPNWATLLNAAITAIDSHNHAGDGVNGQKIPLANLNYNTSLTMGGQAITGAKFVELQQQGSLPTQAASVGRLATNSLGELYYVSPTSNVKIATSTGLALSAISGAIIGDYVTSGALYYKNADTTFAFFTSNSPTYDSTVHAHIMAGNISSVTAGAKLTLRNAVAGSTAGGWQQYSNSNLGWTLALADTAASTAFADTMSAMPLGYNNMLGLGLNTASPSCAMDIHQTVLQSTALSEIMSLRLRQTSGSTASAGFGGRVQFYVSSASGAAASTTSLGALTFARVAANPSAGYVRLSGAFNGSLASAGMEVNGSGQVGLACTADATTAPVSVGGNMFPSAGTYTLGGSSNRWANVYADSLTVTSSVSLAGVTVSGGIVPSSSGSISLGSTGARYLQVWAEKGVFTTAGYLPASSADLVTRHAGNAIVAWTRVNGDGTRPAFWNVQNVTHSGGTGLYTITFRVPVSTDSAVIATVTGDLTSTIVTTSFVDSSNLQVQLRDSATSSATDRPFSVVVIGAPNTLP